MQTITKYPLSISYRRAKEKYGSHSVFKSKLTNADHEFLNSNKLQGNFTLKQIYNILYKTSLYNSLRKGLREELSLKVAITLFSLFMIGIITMMTSYTKLGIGIFALLFVSAIISIGIVTSITEYSKFQLENEIALKGIIYALMKDFGPKQKVYINLNFNEIEQSKVNLLKKYQAGAKKIKVYNKHLFTLKLNVGEHMKLQLEDQFFLKVQNWKTTNRRAGRVKTKYKSKEKGVHKLYYKVLLDSRHYTIADNENRLHFNQMYIERHQTFENKVFELKEGMWEHKSKFKIREVEESDINELLDEVLEHLQQPFLQIKTKESWQLANKK
ncbi:hypothetical protein [Flammeovirga aprica]|uniref:Uncharacterized protein n=1 Tax=Flammeovirga aprica JL-4 TaxID=694437 RepID=A0A7X9XBR7_9BACT|nr:hypothetical protein [Flammeovirga aprica]NME70948.1 hypothetical protein [Flammeovirga aprica JL-4]